jgi:predicted alpha/beta hydrolase
MDLAHPPLAPNASPDLELLHAAFEGPPDADGGQCARLRCDDGVELAAHWYEPAPGRGPARAVAVIHAATGVPQGFYRAFAQWLARRGYAVLTYDYRGIGLSRRGPIQAERATMRDWGRLDMSAALAAAARRRSEGGPAGTPPLPLLLVGHPSAATGSAWRAASTRRRDPDRCSAAR